MLCANVSRSLSTLDEGAFGSCALTFSEEDSAPPQPDWRKVRVSTLPNLGFPFPRFRTSSCPEHQKHEPHFTPGASVLGVWTRFFQGRALSEYFDSPLVLPRYRPPPLPCLIVFRYRPSSHLLRFGGMWYPITTRNIPRKNLRRQDPCSSCINSTSHTLRISIAFHRRAEWRKATSWWKFRDHSASCLLLQKKRKIADKKEKKALAPLLVSLF